MCTALTHEDSLDARPANGAGFPSAVIDSKMMLILTAAVDPIKGSTVAANALLQDPANRSMQDFCLFLCNRIRGSQRVQLCKVQRFIRINIADPGEKRLIEQ